MPSHNIMYLCYKLETWGPQVLGEAEALIVGAVILWAIVRVACTAIGDGRK